MLLDNNIGIELKKIIDKLEITPEEFSLNIGVGKSSVYKVLRGDTKKITKTLAEKVNLFYPEYTINDLLSLNQSKSSSDTNKSEEKKLSGQNSNQLSEEHKRIISNAFLLNRREVMDIPIVKDVIENERLKTKIDILMEIKDKKEK